MWMDGVLPWKSESWVPASRRDGDYDNEKLQHDEKPFYKRMFQTGENTCKQTSKYIDK